LTRERLCHSLRRMNQPASFTWTKVDVLAWNRFSVSELFVAASLPGAVHRFPFNGRHVEIRLPKLPPKPSKWNDSWGNDRIRCYHWQHYKAYAFIVEDVDVYVDMERRLSVPRERLGRVKHDWLDKARRTRLEHTADSGADVAVAAYDYWLRVLRWKSLNGSIGQRRLESKPQRGAYLVTADTRERFYSAAIHLMASAGNFLVRRHHWNRAQQALTQNRQPPTWLDFLFEGQHRIHESDLHGGILCLGIATETVVRTLLKTHLTRPVNQKYLSMVEFVPIARILENWKDLGYWSASRQPHTDLPKLKRLFELRNQIAHKASFASDKTECSGIAQAVYRFIVHALPTTERLARR
jgi:hypothetical protein